MRLALKITWIVLASTAVGLGIQAKIRTDRELQIIDHEMKRDQRVLGRALVPMLEMRYAAQGEEAIDEALALVFNSEREIEVTAVQRDGVPDDVAEQLMAGGEATSTLTGPGAARRLTSYFALDLSDLDNKVLQLSEPLKARDAFVAAALRDFLILLGGLLAGLTVVGAAAGYWLVGRRVERLVRSARAVSAGDYSVTLDDRGWDEIAMLSREMTKTTRRLEAAEQRARGESERRGQLVQRLRHGDRLATVGMLASRVAHDVGTPLNVISARSKMIARGEVQGPEIVRNAEIVCDQADRIADKVRELLNFARAAARPREPVDIARLVRDCESLVESVARRHGVTLQTQLDVEVSVRADALQLQQAVVNLIVNAIHAGPTGSCVEIIVDRVAAADTPSHVAPGEFARVSIRDEGPGVADADRQTVFEPFVTTKDAGSGTGLGLPIASEIVRDHGGWIELVEDERPRNERSGATFELWVPAENNDA